jgi:hypothetical protein
MAIDHPHIIMTGRGSCRRQRVRLRTDLAETYSGRRASGATLGKNAYCQNKGSELPVRIRRSGRSDAGLQQKLA